MNRAQFPMSPLRILVVGGAGYIGAHMVRLLLRRGHLPEVLDNLSTGARDSLLPGVTFHHVELDNRAALQRLFACNAYDAVMHFAGYSRVDESLRFPSRYYRNNVANTLNLLDALQGAGVRHFVFSSSAAVYGTGRASRGGVFTEDDECRPETPYGNSKLMVEQILSDFGHCQGLKWASLRYFNAAGASPDGELGERHDPETHLIPLALQVASGRRAGLSIFGTDYPTPDGTCVRDYVHVCDLCEAHLLALQHMRSGGEPGIFNLGNGDGFTVREVLETARRVTHAAIPVSETGRRPGDPSILVADAERAKTVLGWSPQFTDLETIIAHAWNFERHCHCR